MDKRKIPISLPFTDEEEWLATREPILSGWLTQGPKVAQFEQAFAVKHEVKHALATTSCTTSLHLILTAFGIGRGDEVIVPAFTWVATANAVLYCGATPILADINVDTYNIDIAAIKEKLTSRTKAIVAVHLFGSCVDIDALRKEIPGDVKIVEDAACATGAVINGRYAGSLADAAAFSFHPRKIITTGEGGMVTTNDTDLYEKMVKLRNHGAEISEEQRHQGPKPFLLPDFNLLGFNYRMTDVQGAIGLSQLRKLDKLLTERRKWAEYYCEKLSNLSWLKMPLSEEGRGDSWQAFVTRVVAEKSPLERNEIMEILESEGISTRPGTHAIHTLKYYAELYSYSDQDYPNAKVCHDTTMAIPLHNCMKKEDYDYVIKKIRAVGF